MVNIFEQGTRVNLQFPYKGSQSISQMWSVDRVELMRLADELEQSKPKGTRLEKVSRKTKEDTLTELRIAILDHMIAVKEEEEKELTAKKENKAELDFLLALKQEKRLEKMKAMTEEEVDALLASKK